MPVTDIQDIFFHVGQHQRVSWIDSKRLSCRIVKRFMVIVKCLERKRYQDNNKYTNVL